MKTLLHKLANRRLWAYGLFWLWNIIFLAFMSLGFAPQLLPDMITAVQAGNIPPPFLAIAIIMVVIPVLAVLLGLTVLRREPERLFALGYAIEGPLMLMLLIRLFVVRELVAALAALLIVAALGMIAFVWQLLDRRIDTRGAPLTSLRLIGLTLFLLVALYASLGLAFYAVPIAGALLRGVWEFLTHIGNFFDGLADFFRNIGRNWQWLPFSLLGFLLFAFSATLLVLMPLAVPILVIRAWWRSLRAAITRLGQWRAVALAGTTLAVCAGLFIWTNRQPQQLAFQLLETPPANAAQAEQLLNQQQTIRAGLLNAYLAPMRYISAVGEVQHVSGMYQWSVGLSEDQARAVEQMYETVASPLLYTPVHPAKPGAIQDNLALNKEPREAEKLYAQFFDQPIIEGEHETIATAVRSTWNADQAQIAVRAVDDSQVHLNRQEITVTEHNDWAEVELYEVYQNRSSQRQEVIYYFTLPESAVVTGLWLGTTEDRGQRSVYRVSPRGAAQAVYRNEVRRQVDPALVEQIGPRQYRLRIYPVEPQQWLRGPDESRATVKDGPPLHMWLTFDVMNNNNAWPMPYLAQKHNVYWDTQTLRMVNGKPAMPNAEAWLPASIPANTRVEPAAHRVDLADQTTVIARPVSANELPKLAPGLKLAVVLDRSRSMAKRAAEVTAALARVREVADADVYLTSSPYRGEPASRVRLSEIDPARLTFYGGQNAAELLAQFETLRASDKYDAILVLTDGSGYTLGTSQAKVTVPDAPVWMVHLGGSFPLGYDDDTLEAIQASGGSVTGSVEEAFTRLAVARAVSSGASFAGAPAGTLADWVDGYAWYTMPTAAAPTTGANDKFAPLAARYLILTSAQRQRASLGQVSTLDRLHALAIQHSVVTPYSSMIVLVTFGQQLLLDHLEQSSDRFDREMEDTGATLAQNAFAVTGVPEPHEWLLLALVAGMVLWYIRGARRTSRAQTP